MIYFQKTSFRTWYTNFFIKKKQGLKLKIKILEKPKFKEIF
jgi:hypothetical protein